MSVIENFAALSAQEQREFAAGLLTKINSEHIFSEDISFELVDLKADDLTGGLIIKASHTDSIPVTREASWTCEKEEDAEYPGRDADYVNTIYEDAKKAFKTLSTVLEGYNISLEIIDVDEGEIVDAEVDQISHEDAGIGDYEYFGFRGHDSQPYIQVEGTITTDCDLTLTFFAEPTDDTSVEN